MNEDSTRILFCLNFFSGLRVLPKYSCRLYTSCTWSWKTIQKKISKKRWKTTFCVMTICVNLTPWKLLKRTFPCLPHSTWCGETSGKLLIDYIWRTTNILSVRKCTVPMKPFLLVTTPWLQSKHSPGFPDSRKLPIPCHRHITFSSFIGTSNAETLILQSAEGKARNLSSEESMPSSYQNWHK